LYAGGHHSDRSRSLKYLQSQEVDEIAYGVPDISLMLGAEANFDEDNPADYY
jgi:hypothetical protein